MSSAVRTIAVPGAVYPLYAPNGIVPDDTETPRFVMTFPGDGTTSGSVKQLSLAEIEDAHSYALSGMPDQLSGNLFALTGVGELVRAKLISLTDERIEEDESVSKAPRFSSYRWVAQDWAVVDHGLRYWFGSFTIRITQPKQV